MVGRILIPKIGIDKCVVEGVNVDDLRKGPGHYPTTQMPGHEGNSAIAGHRTTYDHPFGDLDQLGIGDEVRVVTLQGDFHYKVTEQRVVDPSEVSVLDPTPDPARPGHQLATLTLTTCNPKYSAEQRLIIKAQLQLPPGRPRRCRPPRSRAASRPTTIGGLSGESSSRTPTILWGASRWRSGCCGGSCSTATRAGRRGSWACSRSSPRCSSPTRTSSGCCRRTTDRPRGSSASVTTRRSAR